MKTLESFSRSHDAIIERLFQVSGCARFAVSKPDFATALYRACQRRFNAVRVDLVEMQEFLESLHVADLALALACRAGNEEAWREFHDAYSAIVERDARAVVGDSVRAQELADTFWGDLYALGRGIHGRKSPFDHYHGRSSLRTWLRAVMLRRKADAWRQLSRKNIVKNNAVLESASIDSAFTRAPDPDRARYLAILADVLGRVLDELDPRDQSRLSYYYVNGLPLSKIGALMNDHESTVSRGLLRTRREIRRQVERRLRRDHRLSDDQLRRCFEYATDEWPLDLAGAFIGQLRRSGFDVVMVMDCAGSMKVIVRDIKAKMLQLEQAIHRLVPIARIGLVVFAGKHQKRQVLPMTHSPEKVQAFLQGMIAMEGGEWAGDTLAACRQAITSMEWRPSARKVIVLIGDSPPAKNEGAELLGLIRDFRNRNGTFNTINVAEEEHERFEREFWMKLHGEEPPTISPLPEFYQQAHAAYQALADAGGGTMRSLTKDHHINYQVLIIAFGVQWQNQVAAYGEAIESGGSNSRADTRAEPNQS